RPVAIRFGEVGVEVEVDGAREMAGTVGLGARARLAEHPATVDDPDAIGSIDHELTQLVGGDHRPPLAHWPSIPSLLPMLSEASAILSRGVRPVRAGPRRRIVTDRRPFAPA